MTAVVSRDTADLERAGEQAHRVAVIAALSAATMLFASLVSAYLVRRSFDDWRVAPAVWPFFLLVFAFGASVGIERAARVEGQARERALRGLVAASFLYLAGAVFVLGRIVSSDAGLSAPHAAFVFILLGAHVAHALLGAGFSGWILDPRRGRPVSRADWDLARLVTHFLTALLFGIILVLYGLR